MIIFSLDYRVEPGRLEELKEMKHKMSELLDSMSDKYLIWTGDFNALTREDYDEHTWQRITNVRAKNMWELPQTELTTEVLTAS